MRILQVADFYWPYLGGVEQHVRTLSQGLASAGHDVHVATLRTGDARRLDSDGEVTIHRIPSTTGRLARLFSSSERPWAPPLPDPEALVALARLIRQLRPDVVHGHDWLARSYLPLHRWARRRYGTRYVSSLHYYTLSCAKKDRIDRSSGALGQVTPCPGPTLGRCISCTMSHYGPIQGPVTLAGSALGARAERATADTMIAVSRATAVGNGLDPDEVTIIGNPVRASTGGDDELERRLPSEFILFVGDLRPMKGLDVLFDAYEMLTRSVTVDVPPLVVIGKRWPDTPTDVPAGVTVFERWPNADVLRAWSSATIGVVPSVWDEPFGIVAVEALRGGTPVIASDVGGLSEIVRDGVDGLLVPPADPVALCDALSSLLIDAQRRSMMSCEARRRGADFDAARVVAAIEATYQA